MGLIKKGSRLITVDGIVYRWRYSPKPNQDHEDGYAGVIVPVQELNYQKGSILYLIFDRYHMSGAYSEPEMRKRKPVLPSEIALCIREAIKAGWQSNLCGKGKQFVLNVKKDWFDREKYV